MEKMSCRTPERVTEDYRLQDMIRSLGAAGYRIITEDDPVRGCILIAVRFNGIKEYSQDVRIPFDGLMNGYEREESIKKAILGIVNRINENVKRDMLASRSLVTINLSNATETQGLEIWEKLAERARAEEADGKTNNMDEYCAKYPEELLRIVNTTPTDEKSQEEANTTFREYIEKRFYRRD